MVKLSPDEQEVRFLARVVVPANLMTDCWGWTGHVKKSGYTMFTIGRVPDYAHRIMFRMVGGELVDGLELDHRCRNPGCVNPAHLEQVTHKENMRRSYNAIKTHCMRGHEFTPENTRRYAGGRRCRLCASAYQQEWKAQRRQTT